MSDGGNAVMADKQLNFRQDYRARIAGWYNGYVHIAVIYVIGGTALYIYSQHMGQVLVVGMVDHSNSNFLMQYF